MDSNPTPPPDREGRPGPSELLASLSRHVVGQPTALETIVPSLQLHESGLAPDDRPVGVFLLLGPTGTGKTRTVEAVADVLHGDIHRVLRVDCGEFQSDHEVAKLIGAPPGYVGHAETKARLTPGSLAEVTSPSCDLALVLFDEIEKAAPALVQLLLGVLDRARLRLGDGTEVNFAKTLIFLTSNLGAREMMDEIRPPMGFAAEQTVSEEDLPERLERIGLRAVKKFFSPEFVNRIDAVVTYRPLDRASVVAICDQQIQALQEHVHGRLGSRSFEIRLTPEAHALLIDEGTSLEYGARELKRVVHRQVTQPLAAMVARQEVPPGSVVTVSVTEGGDGLALAVSEGGAPKPPTVLAVDDNAQILAWMTRVLENEGYRTLPAHSVREAASRAAKDAPDVAVVDVLLPDGDGVVLAAELLHDHPDLGVVLVSGMELDEESEATQRRHGFQLLRKPFLAREFLAAVRASGNRTRSAGSATL